MTPVLYRSAGPVTLVGGGPVSPGQLAEALALAPEIVAADGGADLELPAGRDFAAVIGDMDSVNATAALVARGVPVYPIAEQDSTDLEKCLRSVEAPLFLGLGFLGGRIDHQLAAMNALVGAAGKAVVLIGGEDICFHCPSEIELDLPAGTRVSLFPMAAVRGVRSQGLRWPVEGLEFRPDARIGTSNQALGGPVSVGFDAPGMLVILPRAALRSAAGRLSADAGFRPRSP